MKKLIFGGRKVQQPTPQQPQTTPNGKLLRKPTIDSVDGGEQRQRRMMVQQQTQQAQVLPPSTGTQPPHPHPHPHPPPASLSRSLPPLPPSNLPLDAIPAQQQQQQQQLLQSQQQREYDYRVPPPQRASLQLQRNPAQPLPPPLTTAGAVPSTRKTSTESSPDASWIVVAAATPNGHPTTATVGTVDASSNTTTTTNPSADPLFVRAQPSFESRSSSLASLPPGASPPVAYPPPSPYNASDPPAPPPPQTRSKQQSNDNISMASDHPTPLPQQASVKSHHHHDKPRRGLFDWLGGAEKEKIARERTRAAPPPGAAIPSLAPDGQPWDLTRLMGFVTATASEDWALLMELCDRASTEPGAKEAAKALRSEIKYADPPAMLSAARLWAIMLRNTRSPFIAQTSSKKFIESVEDAFNEPDTSPVVRDRLLTVIAGASFQFGDKYPGFRNLWKRVKAPNAPLDGVPFDPKDAMFSPPARRLPKPGHQLSDPNVRISTIEVMPAGADPIVSLQSPPMNGLPPSQQQQRPSKHRHRSSRMGIISPEEDMRRLFEECNIAKSNAVVLNNALTFAKPEDVVSGGQGGVIREFHSNCLRSQELIVAQIPWATAQADRARALFLQHNPDAPETESHTSEEDLLAELLAAHGELIDAFRVYDEMEQLGVAEREEREVQERSRVETRLDRTQIQYYSADGSFMTQPSIPSVGVAGGSRSASPSPALQQQQLQRTPQQHHPLPQPPQAQGQTHHTNGSSHTLAPPPPAPHGPRSRTPSPERRSLDVSRNGNGTGGRLDSLKRGMSKLGLDHVIVGSGRSRSGSLKEGSGAGRKAASGKERAVDDAHLAVVGAGAGVGVDDEETVMTPIEPSAKALGKRRAETPQDEAFDVDDIFKDHQRAPTPLMGPLEDHAASLGLNSDNDDSTDSGGAEGPNHNPNHHHHHHPHKVVYAYDAAAEREKEWLKAIKDGAAPEVGAAAV